MRRAEVAPAVLSFQTAQRGGYLRKCGLLPQFFGNEVLHVEYASSVLKGWLVTHPHEGGWSLPAGLDLSGWEWNGLR
jgi:hypothetical protein